MVKNMTYDELILRIIILLRDGKRKEFQNVLEELQPYDMAILFKEMPEKYRGRYLSFLTVEDITDLMGELDREEQLVVLNKVGKEKAIHVMNKMDNDDLAALFEEMDSELKDQLLSSMEAEESEAVRVLMNYPPETAGRIMTNRYVWIPQHYTVKEAVVKLKSFAEIAESINYLYVINEQKQLVGVISYRDLILAEPDEKVQELMFTRVISADALQDQEEVARL
ncbi:magnesium transporter, partial [Bacillus haynesii]